MSAQWRDAFDEARGALRPMTSSHLDAVMAIETAAYSFPWSRGNFIDSLVAGYGVQVLLSDRGAMLGYFVAMGGVDEMHLLNITVAPAMQGRGHARHMIDALLALCRTSAARQLWLEVRESNVRHKGMRKGYYPAAFGRREDAVVMSLKIGAADALE